MMIAATILIILLATLLLAEQSFVRQLILIVGVLVLVLQLMQLFLRPFVFMVTQQFQFVPYSELLVMCCIALFLSNIVSELLQQLELESLVPISELTIRFSLFAYCLKELQPALQKMTELLFSLA